MRTATCPPCAAAPTPAELLAAPAGAGSGGPLSQQADRHPEAPSRRERNAASGWRCRSRASLLRVELAGCVSTLMPLALYAGAFPRCRMTRAAAGALLARKVRRAE